MTDEDRIHRFFTTAGRVAPVYPPVAPTKKTAVIRFDLADAPEAHTLDCDAAAADLVPVLRALLARIEGGALRMPVTDGLRWVEDPE